MGIAEFVQSVCVPFLYSTETHVTDAVAHFTHIQQCRAQGLEWEHKTLINTTVQNNIQVRKLLVHSGFATYSDFKDIGFTAVKRNAKFQTRGRYVEGVPFVNRRYTKRACKGLGFPV